MNAKYLMIIPFLMVGIIMVNAQKKVSVPKTKRNASNNVTDTTKVSPTTAASGSNRNIMLSAVSNTDARSINIGIPEKVGGMVIFENDLPIVIYQNVEYPGRSWKANASMERVGLLQPDKVLTGTNIAGYGVNSYTKLGGENTKVAGSITANSFGLYNGDINVSGPISNKNKWYYSVGAYYVSDPGSTTHSGFNYFADKTTMYNVGITKRFKRGEISILYKYANSTANTNYAIFTYGHNGSITPLSGFKMGSDSYMINSGKLRYLNPITGEYYWASLGETNNAATKVNNIDVVGKYDFGKNWNLKYTFRYHIADVSVLRYNCTSIATATAANGFTDLYGNSYAGDVQTVFTGNLNGTDLTTIQGRVDLTKKLKSHLFSISAYGQHYDEGKDGFHNDRTYFYQAVEAQPRQLVRTSGTASSSFSYTDKYGFYNYNVGLPYHKGRENRFLITFRDDWNITKNLKIGYGLGIRDEAQHVIWSPQARTNGFMITSSTQMKTADNHWTNFIGSVNADYHFTKYFGAKLDLNYLENNIDFDSYQTNVQPLTSVSKTQIATFQLYFNHPKFNIVSGVTILGKTNNNQRLSYTNPANGVVATMNQLYDTKTLGWTTDMIVKPFKGFTLHYLLTIQNPIYKTFHFTAFGNDYSYDDNVVLGISKILQEIDPSYTTPNNKFRFWASIRTYSKQYANYTNVLYFKGWYETFCGMNYNMNKNTSFGLTVTNPFNQRGAKGTISGAELITDPTPYYGRTMVSSYIIPFNIAGSVRFNF